MMTSPPRIHASILFFVVFLVSTSVLAGLDTGLVAWYRFEGGLADSSGNANHGSTSSGVSYVPGHDGQAASFNGINQFVTLPGDLWTTAFTTSFWVRTTAVAPGGSDWYLGLGMVDGEVCGSPPGGISASP